MGTNLPKTLYICYFGLHEPLVQTQVLPYLREIKKGGIEISLLTFEPNSDKRWTQDQITSHKRKLADEGIEWNFLPYHKWPSVPATLFDILRGAVFIWRKSRNEQIDVLHARVHVPALMAALAKKFTFDKKPKILFDIRGFFPEEYVDAGVWKPNGRLYRATKRVESWVFDQSDAFVVLTEKARKILFPKSTGIGLDKKGRPIEVIPCCTDLDKFAQKSNNTRKNIRADHKLGDRIVVVYLGSFGGWYMDNEMLEFFGAALKQDKSTFALILTINDSFALADKLKSRGYKDSDFLIKQLSHDEVPAYLNASDVALSFIKPCYSKQASSPTKLAEYLACGLPVIHNSGVGEVDELIENEKVGQLVNDFDTQSYIKALNEVAALKQDPTLADRCRETAKKFFDLETVGGPKYRRIYSLLTEKNGR